MKQKSFVRMLCLLVMAAMVFAIFAGCQKTDSTGETTKGTTASMKREEPLAPFAQTVTVTKPGVELSNVKYVEGESLEDNFVSRKYKEVINVEYKNKWVVESAMAGEKLNLAIASDDLPDTFVVDATTVANLIKADQIIDLTDAYERFASDSLKTVMGYQEKRGFLGATYEGKTYGLPLSNDFADNVSIVYIRTDWMKKLGLSDPKTMDDLFEIARAFVKNDPDGNGVADTLGFGVSKTWNYAGVAINTFANPYKAYPGIWIKDSKGDLVYGSIQPEMKDALKKLQEAYAEKLLDPEFPVIDDNKVNEQLAQNRFGIYMGPFWVPVWPLSTTVVEGSDIDWTAYPIPVNIDGKLVTQNKVFAYTWIVVSKKAGPDAAEAVVKSCNLWYEIFHGSLSTWYNELRATEKYQPVADGSHMYALPQFFAEPDKNLKLGINMTEALNANDPSLLKTAEGRMQWDVIQAGGPSGWGWRKFLTESENKVLQQYEFIFDEFVTGPTKTMQLRNVTLAQLEGDTFMKIILGDSIDTFDTFVSQWKSTGGDEITTEVNAWYQGTK